MNSVKRVCIEHPMMFGAVINSTMVGMLIMIITAPLWAHLVN